MAVDNASWYRRESDLVDAIRARRKEGASYRDLQSYLWQQEDIHCPVDSLRRIFSEMGWNREHSDDNIVDFEKKRIGVLSERVEGKERLSGTANWEYFVDALERAVTVREPLEPFVPPLRDDEYPTVIPLVMLSDVHAGQWIQEKEVGERLAYGSDAFSERMMLWALGVDNILRTTKAYANVEHVAIVGLGDYIENAGMREGASRYTHQTNAEAVVEFCEAFLTVFQMLCNWHNDLTWSIDWTNGNHDEIRNGAKGITHIWESYGYIIGNYIRRATSRHDDRIFVFTHTEGSVLLELGRNQILVVHGHTTSGGQFPYAAIESLADRYAGFHRSKSQFLICGHYHHGASWVGNNGVHCIMNPAFADTNSFAARGALLNPAGQKVLIFLEDGGLYAEHTIPLSPPIQSSVPHIRGKSA